MINKNDTDQKAWTAPPSRPEGADEDPYSPPDAEIKPSAPVTYSEYELAKRDQRAMNLILDLLLSYVLMLILMVLLEFTGIFTALSIEDIAQALPEWVTWLLFLFGYYLYCEGVWGKTIAKMITGTVVINISGQPASFSNILNRTLIRFIPVDFISFLPGGEYPSGWHDRWSDTCVIRDR
ncbi:MAG: RDD family protein [Gammaproteobacteria bacterium]|nr:MAG: RDD family protein [Gammaproteobacteria bacterium]